MNICFDKWMIAGRRTGFDDLSCCVCVNTSAARTSTPFGRAWQVANCEVAPLTWGTEAHLEPLMAQLGSGTFFWTAMKDRCTMIFVFRALGMSKHL